MASLGKEGIMVASHNEQKACAWMSYIPNLLSLSRIPLALLFLSDSMIARFVSLFLAGCTDALDGWLARKLKIDSSWGAILDPIGDKCFAAIVFSILWMEGTLSLLQIGALMTREAALCCFALLLAWRGSLSQYRVRAIWTGKVLTMLQGTIVLLLIFHQHVPLFAYVLSFLLGAMAFVELVLRPENAPALQ